MKVSIRRAGIKDLENILEINESLERGYNPEIDDKLYATVLEDYKKLMAETLTNPDYQVFVSEIEKKIIGFIVGNSNESGSDLMKSYYIAETHVEKDHRRQGIGTKLYETIFSYARENGFSEVFSFINPKNKASIGAKIKLGFYKSGFNYFGLEVYVKRL